MHTIGLVGLGRMGLSIALRLHEAGFPVVGYDPNTQALSAAAEHGIITTHALDLLAEQASIIWLMVPAGPIVDSTIATILPHITNKTIIIDGGNSFYKDSIRRATMLAEKEITFIDCGTSGGLAGRTHGYSLMLGGDSSAINNLMPIFNAVGAHNGIEHVGPAGAGHYVKMVHNGIEYALLQAYGEGFDLLKHGPYKDLDLKQIASVWQHGSVIRSWIVELCKNIFAHDQDLSSISGSISENETGKWTSQEAKERNIPVKLIDESLAIRAWSRETGGNYGTKVVALLRNAFGGHPIKK